MDNGDKSVNNPNYQVVSMWKADGTKRGIRHVDNGDKSPKFLIFKVFIVGKKLWINFCVFLM